MSRSLTAQQQPPARRHKQQSQQDSFPVCKRPVQTIAFSPTGTFACAGQDDCIGLYKFEGSDDDVVPAPQCASSARHAR